MCKENKGKHKRNFAHGHLKTRRVHAHFCTYRKGHPETLIITDGDHVISCKKQNPLNVADTKFYAGKVDILGFEDTDVERIFKTLNH